MRRAVLGVVLLGVIASCCGCSGRGGDFRRVMSGKRYPLTVRLGELDSNWRSLTLGGGGSVELASFYSAMLGGGTYYTRGETVRIGGEVYLVAYTVARKPADLATMFSSGGPPGPQEVNAMTRAALSLVNLRMAGALNAIRPFNLREETVRQPEPYARSAGTRGLSNLKNLALAVQMFATDNNGKLPNLTDVDAGKEALSDYVRNDTVFYDPDTGQAYVPNAALSGKNLADISDPAQAAVFYEADVGEDGRRGVGFCDGHASRLSESQWDEVKKASGIP